MLVHEIQIVHFWLSLIYNKLFYLLFLDLLNIFYLLLIIIYSLKYI